MLDPVDRVCTWSGQLSSEFVNQNQHIFGFEAQTKICSSDYLGISQFPAKTRRGFSFYSVRSFISWSVPFQAWRKEEAPRADITAVRSPRGNGKFVR